MTHSQKTFCAGLLTGVMLSIAVYFVILHESVQFAISPDVSAGRARPTLRVDALSETVDFDEENLHELAQLSLSELENRLNLKIGATKQAGEFRWMFDDWPRSGFSKCDRVLAIPISESGNYLVLGVLYSHAHVVSAFHPRWKYNEPSDARAN